MLFLVMCDNVNSFARYIHGAHVGSKNIVVSEAYGLYL